MVYASRRERQAIFLSIRTRHACGATGKSPIWVRIE
jgi:hypothetical protein